MDINNATLDFIHQHRTEDVRTLALKAQRNADIDLTFALQQIDGWQRARTKLPMWAAHEGIIYPPHISMEQCSSEQTARYKAELLHSMGAIRLTDLTGGFGVDFSYMSQAVADNATYIEQQPHLCDIARHNFHALGLSNTTIVNQTAEEYLHSKLPLGEDSRRGCCIFLDPARRDANGRKTYAISDCTPDIVALWQMLRDRADIVMVKLSPMLDHHEALRLLPGINEVHIVSVRNECKELVLVSNALAADADGTKLVCVNDDNRFETTINSAAALSICNDICQGDVLLVPNASVMKGGCFADVCHHFAVQAVGNDSRLFIAKNTDSIANFPGKTFCIDAISSLNKHDLKQCLSGITHANIAVRNFKLSADELRKKLKLKDGGEHYIFGTIVNRQQVLLVCRKIHV